MTAVEALAISSGSWRGTSVLQDPMNNIADRSESSATVTPAAAGKFIRIDYTWSYKGESQEGSYLIGVNPKSGEVTAHWIDSWHNGTRAMPCLGTLAEGKISVLGSYPAPPGPDWGWKTEIVPGRDALSIVMYNVWPEGKEELAVEMSFERA